jgi:starvation-inducible DNA-binding protein
MTKRTPTRKAGNGTAATSENQPILGQRGPQTQRYGTVRNLPIALDAKARQQSCDLLNQILADTITLYSMYKKHHWQVSGHTFYQLHLLFDKHADEQLALVDAIAERIQLLGGISTGMPADVAKLSRIENPPPGAEEVPVQISRLLEAHEVICREVRAGIETTEESKDWGTNDLLMSDVLRSNELQVWFVASHLVDEPLVRASDGNGA